VKEGKDSPGLGWSVQVSGRDKGGEKGTKKTPAVFTVRGVRPKGQKRTTNSICNGGRIVTKGGGETKTKKQHFWGNGKDRGEPRRTEKLMEGIIHISGRQRGSGGEARKKPWGGRLGGKQGGVGG